MPTIELLGVLVLGLFFFLLEEFRNAPAYSLLTLAFAVVMAGGLSRLVYRQQRPLLSWCMLGAVTAALTAVIRPALVYGGYVSYLKGVDCFARLGLDNITYLLFAVSGAVAGGLISRYDPRGWLRVLPLLGIALGILYHYKLAQGFWSSPLTLNGALLLSTEFMAPSIYAWPMAVLGRRLGAMDDLPSPGTIPRFVPLTENDRMLLPHQIAFLKSHIHSVATDVLNVQDPSDEMLPECAFFIPNLLAEFRENLNLAMIHGRGTAHAWIDVKKLREILTSRGSEITDYRSLFRAFRDRGYDVKKIKYINFRSALSSTDD